MPRITMADLAAQVAALTAQLAASAPVADAEASQHFKLRDIPCAATPSCGRTFKTAARAATHGIEQGGHAAPRKAK